MAVETLTWPGPPTLTDNNDSGQSYDMGVAFTVPAPVTCSGLRWRVPDSVSAPPGGTHRARIWADGTKVRDQVVTPVTGGDQDIPWTVQGDLTLTPGVAYIASVWTVHYTFRAGAAAYPITTPSALASASGSRLGITSDPNSVTAPDGVGTSIFFVSPLLGEADAGVVTLTGTLTLPHLTLTGALTRTTPPAVSGALTLPHLTLTGTLTNDDPVGTEPEHGFRLRADLAEALSAVAGVQGYARKPAAARTGDAWPRIGTMTHIAPGAWETEWQIVILLPQDDGKQDDWIITRLEDIEDVLAPLVWIVSIEAGASADAPALLINCRE